MPDAVCTECGGSGWTLAIINYTCDESGPSWSYGNTPCICTEKGGPYDA